MILLILFLCSHAIACSHVTGEEDMRVISMDDFKLRIAQSMKQSEELQKKNAIMHTTLLEHLCKIDKTEDLQKLDSSAKTILGIINKTSPYPLVPLVVTDPQNRLFSFTISVFYNAFNFMTNHRFGSDQREDMKEAYLSLFSSFESFCREKLESSSQVHVNKDYQQYFAWKCILLEC
ncbi:MAG: hypothetical protein OXC30_00410 [Alphaproteobacteria bacterium]|nr:hypothetical protein [Alphaproteobacteria bacterium]